MQINLIMLGIGLAVLFFGYFFGLFEGRGQGYKRRKKEEEEEKRTRAAIEKPLPPPPPVIENCLLKISLDEKNELRLDMDGQRMDTSQLTDDQRKRLKDLLVMARPWIDTSVQQKPAVTPQPAVRSTSASASTPVPAPVSGQRPTLVPVAPILPSKPEVAAPTTMVGQIDAILQMRLIGTPLAGRGVRLVESSEGGVAVVVGMNSYPGVGEVPDPAIQDAIRAAISEWEQKYTPI